MLAKLKLPGSKARELERQLDAAHETIADKTKSIKQLEKRVQWLEQKLKAVRQKLVLKDEAVNTIRERLATRDQAMRALRDKLALKDDAIKRLRDRVETSNFGFDPREIDPLAHNSAHGMDAFFASVDNLEPYIAFGLAIRSLLDKHSIELKNKRVLDFGTGPGVALKACLEDAGCAKVVGHDYSNAALDFAQTYFPEATFSIADIYSGTNESYDIVLCTEVLEHLENPAVALETLTRMTNQGGYLFISVPDGRRDLSLLHINFWSPESWRLFLETQVGAALIATGTFKLQEKKHQQHNYALIQP